MRTFTIGPLFALCGLLLSGGVSLEAQVQEAWVRTYNAGQMDRSVAVVSDGLDGVYVTGYSRNDSDDFVTIKYWADGTEVWVQRYEGPDNALDRPSAVAASAEGYVWVTGISEGTNGMTAWVIMRYDPEGNLSWVSRSGGDDSIEAGSSPIGLVLNSSGNAYIAGPKNGREFAVMKYSPDGEQLWVQFAGMYQDPRPTVMVIDAMGQVIVTGTATGLLDAYDIFTVKYDPNGTILWSSRYDGNGNEEMQSAAAVCVDQSGNIFVTGTRSSGVDGGWFVTVKYSPDGVMLWDASYAGTAGEGYSGAAVQADLNGNVYVSGEILYIAGGNWARDIGTVKYDPNGVQLWASRYQRGTSAYYSLNNVLAVDNSGNAYVGVSDAFATVKYNSDGNLVWAVSRPSSFATALAVNPSGNVLRTGVVTPPSSDDAGDFLTVSYAQTDIPSQPLAFVSPPGAESIIGSNATFNAVVQGPGPFTYQWRFNGRPIGSAIGPQLHLASVPLAAAGDYSVIVSNAAGYTISPEARLVLHVPAMITSRAQTNTVLIGESITLIATAIGEAPVSFQWMFNGVAIPDAASSELSLSNLLESASGLYAVEVRNLYGAAVSQPYKLTVVPGSLGLTLKGSWPGYTRRPFHDVTVVSNRAYVTLGREGFAIFDISNPARPERLGIHATFGSAGTVSVNEGYAYVMEGQRWTGSNYLGALEVFDVRDPANPSFVSSFDVQGYIGSGNNNVVVIGQYAYVADGSAGLQIWDVTLPWQPIRVGEYVANGFASRVRVVGHYAFVAYGLAGLHILDVSDPVNPRRVGAYAPCSGQIRDVAIAGNYAYAADPVNGVVIIDVSDVHNPIHVGGNGRPQLAEQVRVAGNRLYALGNHWDVNHFVTDLVLFDLTDPEDPLRIGRSEVETYSQTASFDLAGAYAFVASRGTGLQVIDFSNPATATAVGGETTGFSRGVRVVGNRAYLADGFAGLQVLDVSDPANPSRIGGYDTGWALDIDVAGNRAYIADAGALVVADVTNPSHPVQIGSFRTGSDGEQSAVQVVNNLAYLVDGSGDLRIVDISNPANPVSVGRYAVTNGLAYGVHVSGNLAYLVGKRFLGEDNEIGSLHILDVSQPSNPVHLSRTDTATIGHSVALKGQFAFIAGEGVSLTIVNVSNPANPLTVSQFGNDWAEGMQVVGNYAYLVGQHIGVMVVDVTDRANPYRLAHYPFDNFNDEDEGCDIQVVGNLAYVTRGADGLLVFEITGLPRINSMRRIGNNVVLSWNGSAGLKLQRTASLTNPNWTDVSGSTGQSQATLSIGAGNEFFRLVRP